MRLIPCILILALSACGQPTSVQSKADVIRVLSASGALNITGAVQPAREHDVSAPCIKSGRLTLKSAPAHEPYLGFEYTYDACAMNDVYTWDGAGLLLSSIELDGDALTIDAVLDGTIEISNAKERVRDTFEFRDFKVHAAGPTNAVVRTADGVIVANGTAHTFANEPWAPETVD